MNNSPDKNRIYRDLVDAKCPDKLVCDCMACCENGNPAAILPKLSKQRRHLIERLHEYQDAIDCIDGLAHDLRKTRRKP